MKLSMGGFCEPDLDEVHSPFAQCEAILSAREGGQCGLGKLRGKGEREARWVIW